MVVKKKEDKEEKPKKDTEKSEKKVKEKKGEKKEESRGRKLEREDSKEKKGGALADFEDYVKFGVHLGKRVITPGMRQYVYKRRADGVAVFDTNIIDKKLREAVEFISKFEPSDTIIVCKREAGWKAVKKFSEVTGIKAFTKKYPSGILTNTELPNFFETELVIICDPWLDKNALADANKVKDKVLALCDTNNLTKGIDFIVPCNNKSSKSLGLILYLLAKEYLKAKGSKEKIKIEDFAEDIEEKPEESRKEQKEIEKMKAEIERRLGGEKDREVLN